MSWTESELDSMRAWDAYIDESGWTVDDENASRDIIEALAPVLYRQKIDEVLDRLVTPDPPSVKTYVTEHRPGRGKRKSKGNTKAQAARYRARQKLKKQLAAH